MYHGRKQKFDWTFSIKVGDVLAVALSFPLAFLLYRTIAPEDAAHLLHRFPVPNCIFYGVLTLIFLSRFRLYSWASFMRTKWLARRLPAPLLVSLGAILLVRYAVTGEDQFRFLPFLLVHLLVVYLAIILIRVAVRIFDARVIDGISTERIAFVGWSSRLEQVLQKLRLEMGEHHEMVGYFRDELYPQNAPPERFNYPAVGSIETLKEILVEKEITMLLVDQSKVTWRGLRRMADICSDSIVNLRVIPNTFDVWASRLNLRVVAGIPVLGINDLVHDRFGNRLLKRAVDIVGAMVGLVLSAPIIAILAVMIYRESPGPVFYRQTRLGQGGSAFKIIKLRSMRLDAEQQTGAVWAVGKDARRLKIGTFMRSTNLDELPQFWNVLKGEMTLVGPRPERPEFVDGFRHSVRYYNLRHTCKPGITGWAAVHGLRGDTSLEDRLEYDLFYIENWSLMLDFKILLMTLLPPKNAY